MVAAAEETGVDMEVVAMQQFVRLSAVVTFAPALLSGLFPPGTR
jgi:uncharacterized membrane protein AbrB (regulator of aidB expression)